MTLAYQQTLLNLRLLIGFLGEQNQYSWWPTAFYDSSSRPFLEPVFTKTMRLSQYHGVLEAARRVHDEHLNVGCYHLFRLPEELEQDLHMIVRSGSDQTLACGADQSKVASLASLSRLSSTVSVIGEGPTAVGNIGAIDSAEVLKKIAGSYLSAFERNSRSYPYLVS